MQTIITPASHLNDPDTSFMAEEIMNKSGKRKSQQIMVLTLVKIFGGKTTAEIAKESGEDRAMIARRMSELVTANLVYKGIKVTCKVNNSTAYTWFAV